MIIGQAGITAASGGGGIPPEGAVLFTECLYETIYDYNLTPWTGFYTLRTTYANGSGQTYTEDGIGEGFCYYPSGFLLLREGDYSDFYLSWDDGEGNTGSLFAGQLEPTDTYADGSGGAYTQGGGITWSYADGYIINESETIIVVLRHNNISYPDYYQLINKGCPESGTKVGTPFWYVDSGGGQLMQTFNDGYCGTYSSVWDGSLPYPVNGTTVGEEVDCDNTATDAVGTVFENVCGLTITTVNEYPSTETSFSIDSGLAPSGWHFTGLTIQVEYTDNSYVIYSYPDNLPINPWQYGYRISDGSGGVYIAAENAPAGMALSYNFDYYDSETETVINGNIAADGLGGYYFNGS